MPVPSQIAIDRNRDRDYFAAQQWEFRRHGREIRDRTLGAHRHDGLTAVATGGALKTGPKGPFLLAVLA
ncbi:MAG TPA: hypothetical protein VFK86_09480 [Bauldia sp.]|nr:hypothetical protein [Bauldia sp.]